MFSRGIRLCLHAVDLCLIYMAVTCSWQAMPIVLVGMTSVYSIEGLIDFKAGNSHKRYPNLITVVVTCALFVTYAAVGLVLVIYQRHLLDGVVRGSFMMIAYSVGKHYIGPTCSRGSPRS